MLSTADAEINNLQAKLAKLKLEEKALMRHPGVRKCVAGGIPDARKGEAVMRYVSLKYPQLDAAALPVHCWQFLTGYKAPSLVEILAELPKSSVDKLPRRAAPRAAQAGGRSRRK